MSRHIFAHAQAPAQRHTRHVDSSRSIVHTLTRTLARVADGNLKLEDEKKVADKEKERQRAEEKAGKDDPQWKAKLRKEKAIKHLCAQLSFLIRGRVPSLPRCLTHVMCYVLC